MRISTNGYNKDNGSNITNIKKEALVIDNFQISHYFIQNNLRKIIIFKIHA